MNLKKFANRLKLVLLILAALFSVHFILYNPFFGVTRIDVTGNARVSSDDIAARSGIIVGMNIFRIDTEASSQAMEAHPIIRQAVILRHWDRTVTLKVTERQIWAVIPWGDTFLCIDEEGICFENTNDLPPGDYPIITIEKLSEPISLGQCPNSSATSLIKQIWSTLTPEQRKNISEFHWAQQSSSLNIYTVRGTEIRFGDMERLEEKLKSFDQIMEIEADMEAGGKEVLEYVDIRFKGEPIIKTII
ncbi:MAG: FtsQ-type POTRA domain-containing protein [Syntrophomonadaceae bacterium]